MAKKIELLHTTYDESGNIESQEVVHPLTSPDCIIMENGKTLDEVMGDGIATPTLTHEGTSFKVGVGDSNIEVVNGDVAGMTLKGQSYQNILPKPTTLIMETDEKEFKINDKIDSNIIIDDNIAEIATVKGRTIVNAVQEESASEYTVLGEDLSGQSIVTTNKPEGNIKGITLQGQTLVNTIQEPCKDSYVVLGADDGNLAYDTIIKPSTLYTVRFKHDTVNVDNPLTVDLGGTVQDVTSTEFTITTPSELTHNQLVFSGKNNVVSEVQVIEGDVTNIEYPFFEGMSDVKFSDSKFIARGKNLFGICEFEKGIIDGFPNTDVTITNNSISFGTIGGSVVIKLKGKPNTEYTISFTVNNTSTMTLREWHDKTKTSNENGEVFWYYGSYNENTNGGKYKLENIQIEENSTATSYEPYKGVEVQQDVDSIPLTSDMFEQGTRERGMGFSMQQCPLSSNTARISSKTLIPVKPNSKYTVLGINTSVNHIWGDMYDKDGLVCYDSVLDLTGGISSSKGVSVPHDVHYLCIKVKNANESAISPSDLDSLNLILQEVPQEIVLRGIGDVKDELDLTRGEYIQRIGEIVLDSDVYYSKEIVQNQPQCCYYIQVDNLIRTDTYNKLITASGAQVLRNQHELRQFNGDTKVVAGYNDDAKAYPNENWIYLKIKDINEVSELKSYLSENPITVQYVLGTPIIHKVNLTNTKVIPSYATETHYETITPSDSLIPNITIPSTLNYDVAIKPSTEYTIRANTSDNLTVDLGGTTGTLSNGKVTLTTPATLTHNEVKFSGTGKVKELMVVEGNEIKDNVPFFNGMKDVEMGGIKLVNIARYKSHANGVSVNTNKTTITFDDDGGVGTTSWGVCQFYDELLKPNTMYTIFMNVTKNTSTNEAPVKIQLGDASERFTNINRGFIGKFKEKIVTSNDISERTLALFFRRGQAGQQVVIENPMVIEGDWTHLDEIPFIESEMIIDQPIIRSQGKNLLDLESKPFTVASTGTTFTKSGNTYTVTTLANSETYDYIRMTWTVDNDKWVRDVIGKQLTLSVSSLECTNKNSAARLQLRIECYDGTRQYVAIALGEKGRTFTMPTNTKDLQLQIMTNNSSSVLTEDTTITVSNIRLELGNTATRYEPYKHQTLYSNRVIGYEEGVHYGGITGIKSFNPSFNSVMADVEGLSIAYVTNGSSNFSFWDKDMVFISGKSYLDTSLSTDNKNGFVQVPSNAKYMKFASANTIGYATDYTKATVTGELPLRSLPNGVCDTLNLVTGEYVQRVGEIVLDGSEVWGLNNTNSKTTCYHLTKGSNPQLLSNMKFNTKSMLCNHYTTQETQQSEMHLSNNEGIFALSSYHAIYIVSNIMSTNGTNDFKQYLSQNPVTVQYELETPIVRKLGFTTKGNYSQLTLNGATTKNISKNPVEKNMYHISPFDCAPSTSVTDGLFVIYGDLTVSSYIDYPNVLQKYPSENELIIITSDDIKDANMCRQWLSQNPFTIGYIKNTLSSTSYSNIHKPIFFNNVNVQYLPNNIDIQPELTYQVRTRNSYVMDMMKPNTTYTMKCLAYSNSAKLYVANSSANTSVSSNKTLQFAQSHLDGSKNELVLVGQWYEPMVIEGDVTGKNLPYFKGILSSYHDVDEIEVYSVNKNLFDMSKVKPYEGRATYWWNTIVKENEVVSVRIGDINNGQFGAYIKLDVRPNSVYTLYIEMEKDGEPFDGQIYGYENDDLWGNGTFTGYANTPYHINTSRNAKYITIGFNYGKDFPIGTKLVAKNMRLYLGEESPVYIPHAHSTTLIEMPTRLETVKVVRPKMKNVGISTSTGAEVESTTTVTSDFVPVQPKEFIHVRNGASDRTAHILCYDVNKNFVCYLHGSTQANAYLPENCYFVRINIGKSNCSDLTITRQAWKPIQLNSLPNGVYDEIIMKPNSNKAQLVQRVCKVVLDGVYYPLSASASEVKGDDISCTYSILNNVAGGICQSDKLLNVSYSQDYKNIECIMLGTNTIITSILKTRAYNAGEYAKENPITVYYELTTPIIHEIQLKGYPHVYENGTVTLNTDIPHQTLVSYNVNQEQLINTQNETIIRHDQQIDDLYYYIEMYLEEIYQTELFRMKLELSL